jgi:hypothetical protein
MMMLDNVGFFDVIYSLIIVLLSFLVLRVFFVSLLSFILFTMSSLAVKTASSASIKECRTKALRLYRQWQIAVCRIDTTIVKDRYMATRIINSSHSSW